MASAVRPGTAPTIGHMHRPFAHTLPSTHAAGGLGSGVSGVGVHTTASAAAAAAAAATRSSDLIAGTVLSSAVGASGLGGAGAGESTAAAAAALAQQLRQYDYSETDHIRNLTGKVGLLELLLARVQSVSQSVLSATAKYAPAQAPTRTPLSALAGFVALADRTLALHAYASRKGLPVPTAPKSEVCSLSRFPWCLLSTQCVRVCV